MTGIKLWWCERHYQQLTKGKDFGPEMHRKAKAEEIANRVCASRVCPKPWFQRGIHPVTGQKEGFCAMHLHHIKAGWEDPIDL